MADALSMALTELLRKAEAEPDIDTLREGVRVLTQALMELEVAQHLGAERYQRTAERQGERNGYRERTWDTRVGTLELRVPRVRDGSFSRACWSRASEPSGHWWPPYERHTCRV
jgi:transposase-like protein